MSQIIPLTIDSERKAATGRRTPKWAFISPFQMRLRRGIESYVWSLSSALVESGVEVDILAWPGSVSQPKNGIQSGVSLHQAPSIGYYEKYFAAPYYCGQFLLNRYDHVFVNFAGYGEGLALKLTNAIKAVPFSVVFHFPRTLVPHRYAEFERWGFPARARHLIGVSEFVGQQAEVWARRSVSLIGHGVDATRFRPDESRRHVARKSLGLSDDANILVTSAALEERKGMQWVMRALPHILAVFPETFYVVLGDGRYRAELEALTRDMGLADHVFLPGAVDDVEDYLSAADIGILLSKEEALGLAVLEYAASGIPVVTSKWPPFDDFVSAEWGYTADETDCHATAETITRLLADSEKRAKMGAAGRSLVRANYSWQKVADQYRALVG